MVASSPNFFAISAKFFFFSTTDFRLSIFAFSVWGNKNNTGAVSAGKNPDADALAYQAANATNYLANYSLAVGFAQQQEAIITQKYIALNMIGGDEAWNEYRRTGYPASSASVAAAPVNTIISIASVSTAADRLPTRLLYPSTEFTYNAANVPTGVNKYSTKIFWAK